MQKDKLSRYFQPSYREVATIDLYYISIISTKDYSINICNRKHCHPLEKIYGQTSENWLWNNNRKICSRIDNEFEKC